MKDSTATRMEKKETTARIYTEDFSGDHPDGLLLMAKVGEGKVAVEAYYGYEEGLRVEDLDKMIRFLEKLVSRITKDSASITPTP